MTVSTRMSISLQTRYTDVEVTLEVDATLVVLVLVAPMEKSPLVE